MCERGTWRGFHSRIINDTLSVMEQCTECGQYRAKAVEDCPFVQSDNTKPDMPEPQSSDGKSPWAPDINSEKESDGW